MTGSDPEIHLPITLTLDDHAGPATRISQERLESMVATALVEFDKVSTNHTDGQGDNRSFAARAVKAKPWMAAAGGVLALASGVAAARYFFSAPEPRPVPTPAALVAPAPAHQAAPLPALQRPPTAAAAASESENDDADEADGVEPTSDRGRRALTRSVTAPEDLLQKANQLRAAGRFRDAAQTYSLVYDRFPKSQAAYVARVAAASLELEHLSNPLKARKLFELAVQDRPKGALDLEARQGLSVALRDLEDRSGERDALRSWVKRHPGSPAARRAQVRLVELGGE
jgi:hypothetical protein